MAWTVKPDHTQAERNKREQNTKDPPRHNSYSFDVMVFSFQAKTKDIKFLRQGKKTRNIKVWFMGPIMTKKGNKNAMIPVQIGKERYDSLMACFLRQWLQASLSKSHKVLWIEEIPAFIFLSFFHTIWEKAAWKYVLQVEIDDSQHKDLQVLGLKLLLTVIQVISSVWR